MTESIFFKSAGHKTRLLGAMRAIGKIYGGRLDSEYGAALYILTSDSHTWSAVQGYVTHEGIDFEAMLNECDWSGGPRRMVKLAGDLFGGQTQVSISDLISVVDEDNFQVAISAQLIRRYGLDEDNLK